MILQDGKETLTRLGIMIGELLLAPWHSAVLVSRYAFLHPFVMAPG